MPSTIVCSGLEVARDAELFNSKVLQPPKVDIA
jgi:hypothetical protein